MAATQEQKQINDLVEELELCICNKRQFCTDTLTSPLGDTLMRIPG